MKRALLIGGGLALVALLAAGLYVYTQFDILVKRAIENYGSDMLQAKVQVDGLKIAPAGGEGEIDGLSIGNPKGFKAKHAVQVGRIELAVDPATVTEDVVHVRKIIVISPSLVYEQGKTGSNFDALRRNVSAYIGETSPQEKKSTTKLIVDELRISGARVQYIPSIPTAGMDLSFTLPEIRLRNLGKGRGGITPAELTQAIIDAILTRTAAAIGQGTIPKALDRFFNQ